MPLRLTLKPYELFVINGARIRNGGSSVEFIVENRCRMLRESEMIDPDKADTPARKAYSLIQAVHLSGGLEDFQAFKAFMRKFGDKSDCLGSVFHSAEKLVDDGQTHKALRLLRPHMTSLSG